VAVSGIREELLAAMPPGDASRDAAAHDAEHSIEADVYWLRHANPSVEIVPILAPAARFDRIEEIARRLGDALAAAMKKRDWTLGKDVAIVISADAVHYGPDFRHVPFGDGGIEAYAKATARDRELLMGPVAGPVSVEKIRTLYDTFVDPAEPDTYRVSWCGRFSIPFGMLVLRETAEALGLGAPRGLPLAYATSVGAPELRVRGVGLGETAPANLYHFVGYPAVAWVAP
jgi:AmmeMemoRadiSam system protein B